MNSKDKKTLYIGLAISLIFVIIGVFALSYAMETLAVQAELLGAQENPVYEPPFPDYTITGFENEWGALIIGIAGTLLLFVVGLLVANVLKRKR
jgi:hypothetical protein